MSQTMEIFGKGPESSLEFSSVFRPHKDVCFCAGLLLVACSLNVPAPRQKQQTKLAISPGHSILTPSQPVPVLTP